MRTTKMVHHVAMPELLLALAALGAGAGKGMVGAGDLVLQALVSATKAAGIAGIGVPVAAGGLGGLAASKLTSPSRSQLRALEKRIVNANVDEMIQEHQRRTEANRRRQEGAV